MSSTNRSNVRKEHIADYYITPIKDIETFLIEFNKDVSIDWNNINILDPSSGGDKNHDMSYPQAIKNTFGHCNIKTMDIRDDSLADIKCNYLCTDITVKPLVIFTNPPFCEAMDFVKKALDDVADNGYVIMLLRLNFLETKTRKYFFDNYMPSYIYVHHKRMSFTSDGKTDSVAYAHFVWRKNNYPKFANIRVI